jgi:putative membrane protein
MMFLIGILLLTILTILLYKFFNENKTNINNDSPLDILQKKYARGDIDDTEFERKKQNLQR